MGRKGKEIRKRREGKEGRKEKELGMRKKGNEKRERRNIGVKGETSVGDRTRQELEKKETFPHTPGVTI